MTVGSDEDVRCGLELFWYEDFSGVLVSLFYWCVFVD